MTTPDPVAWLKTAIEADADWKPPSETRLAEALAAGEISVNDFRWVHHAAGLLEADRALKLAILDEHRPADGAVPGEICCITCGDYPQVEYPCKTVRLIAGGYRHRPGWADHWETAGAAQP